MPPLLPPFSPNIIMYCLGLIGNLKDIFSPKKERKTDHTVSVIIPVHNEEESIGRTIESIRRQSVTQKTIVVIDDASTDSTLQVAQGYKDVLVLRNESRLGKARSINRALQLITSDLVAVVDGDTVLEVNFLSKTMGRFDEEDIAAVSGFVVPSKKSRNWWIKKARVIEDLYAQSTLKKGQDLIGGLFVASGCCAVFRTSILRRLEFPLETITEDLDLTWTLQRRGYRVSFENAYAFTIEPSDLSGYINQIKRWYTGFFQSLLKHGWGILDSKPLTLTVFLILIECLFFTLFWISIIGLAAASFLLGSEFNIFRTIFVILLGVDLFTVCFPAIIRAQRIGYLREFLVGIPSYYFFRLINSFVWWSTFTEWLFDYNVGWRRSH